VAQTVNCGAPALVAHAKSMANGTDYGHIWRHLTKKLRKNATKSVMWFGNSKKVINFALA
jgi:hypothetical protein